MGTGKGVCAERSSVGADDRGRHRRRDVAPADRSELRRPLDLEVQAGGADLAPHASAKRLSLLPSGGGVEADSGVVDTQPVEIQIHRQDVKRPGAIYAEQLLVRR